MAIFNGGWGKDRMYGHDKTSDWGGRNDTMFGHDGNDEIYGMRGNDRLFGGEGNDLLVGGLGNDDVFGDSGNDRMIYESGNDTFNGGSGTDTLEFGAIAFLQGSFDMVSSVFALPLASGIDYNVRNGMVRTGDGDTLGTLSLTSVEKMKFTGLDDRVIDSDVGRTIETFDGEDHIEARGGNDTIRAGGGNDFVDGGTGSDTMSGGSGVDELSFASWDALVAPAGQHFATRIVMDDPSASVAGTATLKAFNTQLGMAVRTYETDSFSSFENITATRFNDTVIGDARDNVIKGGAGKDTIEGGAGADTLYGGSGTDTLSYEGSSAGVRMNLLFGFGGGGDAQGDFVYEFENLTGSAHGDTLTGNHGANVIKGGAGGDTISGRLGNDTIDGGSGRDFITGGGGADTLTGGTGNDDFIYTELSDSTVAATDTIRDFHRGDRIDLSAMDANTLRAGNDSFTFHHVIALTGNDSPITIATPVVGQLTLVATAIDTDNDGMADSYMNSLTAHVDADQRVDFKLNVITAISNGSLEASDFLF